MHNGKLVKHSLSTVVNRVTYTRDYYCDIRSTIGFNDFAHDEWVAKTDSNKYVTRDEVKIGAIKRVFKLHAESATDEHPLERPDLWTDMGGVNSVKAFDNILSSQATANEAVSIELNFKMANALALLNINGVNSVIIEQISNIDESVLTAETTYSTIKYAGKDPYSIFFKPIRIKKALLVKNLKWHPNSRIVLTIPYGGEPIEVGSLVTTFLERLAISLYGSSIGFDNDSVRMIDDFGGVTFIEREVTDILNARVLIDTKSVSDVFYMLKSRSKELSLWVGDERDKGLEIMTIIGYPESTTFSIENPQKTEFPITIIGDSNVG